MFGGYFGTVDTLFSNLSPRQTVNPSSGMYTSAIIPTLSVLHHSVSSCKLTFPLGRILMVITTLYKSHH